MDNHFGTKQVVLRVPGLRRLTILSIPNYWVWNYFPKHALFCQVFKLVRAGILSSDIKFMNICPFTMHVKKISVCSKVLVE